MTYAIVEDEMVAAQRLQRMIKDAEPDFVHLGTFESIEETLKYLLEHAQPDVLLLDIHVADGNSLELFKIMEIKSKVIFTTAYDNYAVEAFRKNAIDYLLKPIKTEELKEALERVKVQKIEDKTLKQLSSEYKDRFLIKFGSKLHIIKTIDISYIYSENKICYFVQKNGLKTASDYTLQDLETMLDNKIFFRVNRQFIVHIEAISNMSTYSKARINLKLNPDFKDDIIVSTEKTPEFKEWLKGS